jgi:hypothetical protein
LKSFEKGLNQLNFDVGCREIAQELAAQGPGSDFSVLGSLTHDVFLS